MGRSSHSMNPVASSLRRPITVIVLVIAVVLGAVLALQKMSRDIFPTLDMPTIYVAQPYSEPKASEQPACCCGGASGAVRRCSLG